MRERGQKRAHMAGCKPRWYQNHYKTVNNAKTRSRLACFVRIACEVASYIRALDAVVVLHDSRKLAVGRTRRYCSTIMPKIKDLHCVLSMMISGRKESNASERHAVSNAEYRRDSLHN